MLRKVLVCRVLKPSVPLLLHADVDGSLQALTSSLMAVNTGCIVYKVVSAAVGPPSSRDVQRAMDTGACIVCFGVKMPVPVQRDADSLGVSTVQSECVPCAVTTALSIACCGQQTACSGRYLSVTSMVLAV